MWSGLNILLKHASGVHVGGTVDVVLTELVVSVAGVVVAELVVTGVEDELELLIMDVLVVGGCTQMLPPHVVPITGEVTHELLAVPPTDEVVQVVILLVTGEHVVIGDVQLVVGGGLTQIVLAQMVVVTGVVAHTVFEEPVLQLVLAVAVVEHVVMGDMQADDEEEVELLELELDDELDELEMVLDDELELVLVETVLEVVTGGLTQIVLAHVVVVSGLVTHCDEAPLLEALQTIELSVVVTEHVVIGEVQLGIVEVTPGGGLTQIVLPQVLVVTGTVAQEVGVPFAVLQLVVLVVPVEQVVIGGVQLDTGVVALIVTRAVLVVLM